MFIIEAMERNQNTERSKTVLIIKFIILLYTLVVDYEGSCTYHF